MTRLRAKLYELVKVKAAVAEPGYEVEYVAQLEKVDVDKLIAELQDEIQTLQDARRVQLHPQPTRKFTIKFSGWPSLKGLVATLTSLDTKAGVFHEGGRYKCAAASADHCGCRQEAPSP